MADPKPNFQENKEDNKLEISFDSYWKQGDLREESLSSSIDSLLSEKFPDVLQSLTDVNILDPHYAEKHNNHMDQLIDDQNGIERKLKFKDLNQKKEFLKQVEIIRNFGVDLNKK